MHSSLIHVEHKAYAGRVSVSPGYGGHDRQGHLTPVHAYDVKADTYPEQNRQKQAYEPFLPENKHAWITYPIGYPVWKILCATYEKHDRSRHMVEAGTCLNEVRQRREGAGVAGVISHFYRRSVQYVVYYNGTRSQGSSLSLEDIWA